MSSNDSGYTILETLIALAILASMLTALYAASGASLDLIGSGDTREQAVLLAQSKLDELTAIHDPLPRTTKGAFEGSDFRWEVETHDVPGHAAVPTHYYLQDVRLTILWPKGVRTQSLTVSTRHLGLVQQ